LLIARLLCTRFESKEARDRLLERVLDARAAPSRRMVGGFLETRRDAFDQRQLLLQLDDN